MGYYEKDAYYQPEAFGLTVLDVLSEPDLWYEFHMLVAWQHEDGTVYYASDSGCSCPSPFEWATSLDELEKLTTETWDDFHELVEGFPCNDADRADFLRNVYMALREAARKREAA